MHLLIEVNPNIPIVFSGLGNFPESFFQLRQSCVGKIPGLQGVWANADTLEDCRDELREVLEEWIILGLKMNHHIPAIDGIELNLEKVA